MGKRDILLLLQQKMSDDELITKIQANAYFQRLTDSSELICVAVDV